MVVNKHTRISKLIVENPEVINAIASINKHFKKLKNPVLRRILAPRITVADAAKIGGVSLDFFLNKLEGVGFEIDMENNHNTIEESENQDSEFVRAKTNLVSLDVRPIIGSGSDPFNEIMTIVKSLKENETLEIINSFEPIPLIHKLERKGFVSWTEKTQKDIVRTYFQMDKEIEEKDDLNPKEETSNSNFDEKYKSFVGKLKSIDVRYLEMPEPMTTILHEIELLPEGHALFVDHKKVPQFLLPELKARSFEILYNEKSDHHLQLLIFKV